MKETIELPFLTEGPLPVAYDSADAEQADMAVAKLGQMGAAFRPALQQKIYEFYLQEIDDGSANFSTAQEQLDWEAKHSRDFPGAKAAAQPSEVWPLIRFRRVDTRYKARDGGIIVRVEGNAAWDGEHGIVLHFDADANLLRVSGYGVFL